MPPVRKRLRNLQATTRTVLRRARWIYCHREQRSSFSLGCYYANKFAPTGVQNRLAQSRFGKSLDVQLLMSNHIVFAQKWLCYFEMKIFLLSRYFLVVLRQLLDRFLPAGCVFFLLARQCLVQYLVPLLTLTNKLRNWHGLTRTCYQKLLQLKINLYRFFDVAIRKNGWNCIILQREHHILSIRLVNDCTGFDDKASRYRSVQDELNHTNFGKCNKPAINAVGFHPRICERPISAAGFEAWLARTSAIAVSFKKSIKCLLSPFYTVLQDIPVDIAIFWVLSFSLYQGTFLTVVFRLLRWWSNAAYQRTGSDRASVRILPIKAFPKSIFVLSPQQIQPSFHLGRLVFCGAKPVLIGHSHVLILTLMGIDGTSNFIYNPTIPPNADL